MLRLIVGALVLSVWFIPPAMSDVAQDLRTCDESDLARADRIAACTRLIDAGDRAPNELTWIHARRGGFYLSERDFEAAAADYSVVIELDPTDAAPYHSRGQALAELRRPAEALADFEQAIELNPRRSQSYYRRGLAHRALDQTGPALADFEQAVQLNPNSYWTLNIWANLLFEEGRVDEARTHYASSLQIEPFEYRTYAGRGRVQERDGNIAAAISDYRIAQILNPNLRAPARRLPELVPERAAPDLGPLQFAPPPAGLAIEYIQVVNEVAPPPSDADAFIADLLYWFVGEPDKPLPIERSIVRREFGPTSGTVTPVTVTQPFDANFAPLTIEYETGLLPLVSPQPDGPDIGFAYDGIGAVWQLPRDATTSGTGLVQLQCPDEAMPLFAALGCLPGVATAEMGTIEWSARFAGWEHVLVPAGNRVAARIVYEEVATTVFFGQTLTKPSRITFWIDPEINWWIKRERVADDVVQTLEAMSIELP